MPATDYAATAFDDWIAGEPAEYAWGGFDENLACGLCYTSGTTGNPKGVLYSHRSTVLHALGAVPREQHLLGNRIWGFSPELFTDHDGHLMPGGMALVWLSAHLAPLDFPVPVHGLAISPARHGDEQVAGEGLCEVHRTL